MWNLYKKTIEKRFLPVRLSHGATKRVPKRGYGNNHPSFPSVRLLRSAMGQFPVTQLTRHLNRLPLPGIFFQTVVFNVV